MQKYYCDEVLSDDLANETRPELVDDPKIIKAALSYPSFPAKRSLVQVLPLDWPAHF